jgi:predicted nucleic acid-binding protein
MIFFDTSAIYALADRGDGNHRLARARFAAALETGESFGIHNYVVVESLALLQHRLGIDAALRFARDASRFECEWVDHALHEEAVERLARERRRRVSLVDQVSFLVMRRLGIEVAFAFDPHFEDAGFALWQASGEA